LRGATLGILQPLPQSQSLAHLPQPQSAAKAAPAVTAAIATAAIVDRTIFLMVILHHYLSTIQL
jgi:hypothetical protein